MAKTRLTPFTRLLLFLLFFIPLAFVGASYFNGEDPVANAKALFGMDDRPAPEAAADDRPAYDDVADRPATFENVQDLRAALKDAKARLAVAEEQLARCRAKDVE